MDKGEQRKKIFNVSEAVNFCLYRTVRADVRTKISDAEQTADR